MGNLAKALKNVQMLLWDFHSSLFHSTTV